MSAIVIGRVKSGSRKSIELSASFLQHAFFSLFAGVPLQM